MEMQCLEACELLARGAQRMAGGARGGGAGGSAEDGGREVGQGARDQGRDVGAKARESIQGARVECVAALKLLLQVRVGAVVAEG